MENTEAILRTHRLTKAFGALKAVDDVDFVLPRGELRAIIGPNGAGKSTFFSMLMGKQKPSSGEIYIDGRNIARSKPYQISRMGVSLAFQITNIFPQLSVSDNLRLSAQARHMNFNPLAEANKHKGVEDLLERVLGEISLREKSYELAANLSHGEQKYLEIGIALATEPKILLLDEPTAGMSAEETRATADLIKKLSKKVSIVLVEHDMEVVMRIADKITVFHHGVIIAEDSPENIRRDDEVQRVYLKVD